MLGIPLQNVIFCTLTGKASLVLRVKGNPSNTIHKTFYSVFKTRNSFGFHLKKHIDSSIKLIVVDEAAMVSQPMIEDILSFGTPVLFLGDHNQLPPIFGANKMMTLENADVRLTQAMRQSDSSGILTLANMAINGEPMNIGQYGASKVVRYSDIYDKMQDYDIVLTYTNATRRVVNHIIRQHIGRTSVYPEKGDKILCKMNNYNYLVQYDDIPVYLINGMIGIVNENAKIENDVTEYCRLNFTPDFLTQYGDKDEYKFNVKCFADVFEQYTKDPRKEPFIQMLYDDSIDDDTLGEIGLIDFGYGVTVAASQGSEWKNVLVLASDFKGPVDTYKKWLYTAVTRGKESVTVAFDI